MGKIKDLTGQRFGRLVAIKIVGKTSTGRHPIWLCKCDCGNESSVVGSSLREGLTRSCGCLRKEVAAQATHRIKHNGVNSRLYTIWWGMKQRCCNCKARNYRWYGAKGISICDEWSKFENFKDWAMANGYADNLTIDRINSNGNYCPENCRWITRSENASIAAKEMQRRRKNVQKSN